MSVKVEWAYADQEPAPWLARVARATLRHEGLSANEVDLTVVLTDTATVHELNRRYRGYDKPTDVLAFPDGTLDPETGVRYLGDVVLAVPVAQQQAQRAGHGLEDEICLLTIHGVLHLLGYDDQTPDARRRMWARQQAILEALACRATPPPL